MLGGRLLKKHSVKIPALRQKLKTIFIFPIICLWKLYVANVTKVYMQQQEKKKQTKKKNNKKKTNKQLFCKV